MVLAWCWKMDSARNEHATTKEKEMPRRSEFNSETLVDLVSEEDDDEEKVEFEPLEQPSDNEDARIEAHQESSDDEVNEQDSSDDEVNEQDSSDDEVNEQDSSDDELNEQVNEKDTREASSATNIPITSANVQPSSELAPTGPIVSTNGPAASRNGPVLSTNGPAASSTVPSTNGPVRPTNGPAASKTGLATSTEGPAPSTNGPAAAKHAYATSKSPSLEPISVADSITSIPKSAPEEATHAAPSSKKRKMTNDDDHDSDISGLDEGSSSDSEDDDDDEDQEKKQDNPSAVSTSKKSKAKKERNPNLLKESRKDKRLSLITARFVEYLIQSSDGEIDFAETADIMGVKKRRIYDVINVLEGCELVERLGRSRIRWCGSFPISKLPPLPERVRLASDDHSHRTPKSRLRARYTQTLSDPDYLSNVIKIQRLGEAIDESLKVVRTSISLMAQRLHVDIKDMKLALDSFSQMDLILISTPGSTNIRVHAPLLDITANTVDVLRGVSVEMEEVKGANGLPIPAEKLSVSLIHPVEDRCIALSADTPPKVEPKTATASQLFRTGATTTSASNHHFSFTPEEFLLSQDAMEVIDKLPSSLSQF